VGTCAPTFSCVPFGKVAEAEARVRCRIKYCWILLSAAVLPVVDALELLLGVVPTLGGAGGATVAGVSVVVVLLLFSPDSSSFLVIAISASALLCTSELPLDLCLAAVAEPEAPITNAVRVVNMKSAERNMWSFHSSPKPTLTVDGLCRQRGRRPSASKSMFLTIFKTLIRWGTGRDIAVASSCGPRRLYAPLCLFVDVSQRTPGAQNLK